MKNHGMRKVNTEMTWISMEKIMYKVGKRK